MIMTGIFILMFLAIAFAWFGQRTKAITIFSISFVMAISSFIHHITDSIGLSL